MKPVPVLDSGFIKGYGQWVFGPEKPDPDLDPVQADVLVTGIIQFHLAVPEGPEWIQDAGRQMLNALVLRFHDGIHNADDISQGNFDGADKQLSGAQRLCFQVRRNP